LRAINGAPGQSISAFGLLFKRSERAACAGSAFTAFCAGLGVKEDGQKVILDLELFQSESSSCREGFVEGLVSRGLKPPCVVIIDGNKGLRVAVEKNWPGTAVQRCTVHKLRNLERYATRHAFRGGEERLPSDRLCRVVGL